MFEHAFLGFVQGITEFLPISSSGHLFIAETFLGLTPSLSTEAWLHVGSLLAVLIAFRTDIFKILQDLFSPLSNGRFWQREGVLLGISTLMTIPTGIFTKGLTEDLLSISFVGMMLIVTGIFLFYTRTMTGAKTNITLPVAALCGLVQGLAVAPGISRSGLTIAFLLALGTSPRVATRYSFLLSIPTILAGGAYLFIKEPTHFSFDILIGVFVSALVAWVSIRWMLKHLPKIWNLFIPYCLLMGIYLTTFSA